MAAAPQKAPDGGPPTPSWALKGTGDDATTPFSLEIIKNGTTIDRVPLSGRTLLGRAADAVRVPLLHASISRARRPSGGRARRVTAGRGAAAAAT